MDLEENAERKMIPLVFVQMNFNGSSVYQRLDTGNKVNGEHVNLLSPELEILNVPYNGVGKIKMKPLLTEANGLILDERTKSKVGEETLYDTQYCSVDEKAIQKQEEDSGFGNGLIIPKYS